ncbi:hypothetical protein GGF46_001315 [Coemansia sp. RSA 552]|nr:hypothetical protein GGF46_001315 [Coemansia sp. RSA 552]
MVARDHTPQHVPYDGDSSRSRRRGHERREGPPQSMHSRAAARERTRQTQQQQQQHHAAQSQGTGGVLADLNMLHSQQSRDIHTVFAPTPRDSSVPASVYVSGHLTPTDQWVAVGAESSGVISLTSSDNEDEGAGQARGKAPEPARPRAPVDPGLRQTPVRSSVPPRSPPLPTQSASLDADQQAVHLLRESVASLLSSAGSADSSQVSSARPRPVTGSNSQRAGRYSHQGTYRRPQSPSSLSKVSEPCYPPSAPRRQFTVDHDYFSDIALSGSAAAHSRAVPGASSRGPAPLPTYEEFRQNRLAQEQPYGVFASRDSASVASSAMPQPTESQSSLRRRPNESSTSAATAEASTVVNSAASAAAQYYQNHHPLLSDYAEHRWAARQLSVSSGASRSPFASIRTVSPVLINNSALPLGASLDPDAVSRAQAEAALEQTILCPLDRTLDTSYFAGSKAGGMEKDDPLPNESGGGAGQTWAKYTGYAIVGFGVGTLVGMMCFDLGPAGTPKATRTIPIAGL